MCLTLSYASVSVGIWHTPVAVTLDWLCFAYWLSICPQTSDYVYISVCVWHCLCLCQCTCTNEWMNDRNYIWHIKTSTQNLVWSQCQMHAVHTHRPFIHMTPHHLCNTWLTLFLPVASVPAPGDPGHLAAGNIWPCLCHRVCLTLPRLVSA